MERKKKGSQIKKEREEKVKSSIKTSKEGEDITINVGKPDSLNLFMITENELERLEEGGLNQIFLNFAIFSFSIAIAFLIAILTTTINSDRTFIVFVIITSVGFLAGIILLVVWWKTRVSIKSLVKKIRGRIKEECHEEESVESKLRKIFGSAVCKH